MSNREAYIEQMKAKLDEWSNDITMLEQKAKASTRDMQDKYSDQIAQLKKQRDEAAAKLEELQAASESAWEDIKLGAENAWHSISNALHSAKDKFTGSDSK